MIIRPEQLKDIKESLDQYVDKKIIRDLLDTIIYLVEEYKSTTYSVDAIEK